MLIVNIVVVLVRCDSKQFLVVNTLCFEVYDLYRCCLALDCRLHVIYTGHIVHYD